VLAARRAVIGIIRKPTETGMTSQWIDIPAQDGKTFKGYLALPPAGHGPGIVLIQEIFGVNEHIQSVADQYASDGYVVLAPDLFWRSEPGVQLGYGEDDWEQAFSLMQALDFDLAIDDLRRSVELLRERDDCNGRVASVGYCMGGVLSFLSAANAGHGRLLGAVTELGGRQNTLTLLSSSNEDVSLVNQKIEGELSQLDYAGASIDLNNYQLSLQATQKTYLKINGLSLFGML